MDKKGLIVVNGYFSNDAIKHQTESLVKAFNSRGVQVEIIKGNALSVFIENQGVNCNLPPYDFVIYLDKEILRAQMLEKAGYKLFNSSEVIRVCDDKMLTFVTLSGANIKMPKTIPSPLNYTGATDKEFLALIEKEIGYPVVIKSSYGSMGKGVFKADNYSSLEKIYGDLKCVPHLYQRFIGNGGRDIRVIVIGGKVITAMERVNENDFRSNVEQGGLGKPIVLNEKVVAMAERIAKTLKADYLGIDILFGDNEYYLCEVNSNAFFKGVTQTSGVSVADAYAEYIIKKIGEK